MANNTEVVIWCVRAGREGQADEMFTKKKLIGLGWNEAGDLSVLAPDREAFKAKIAETYPQYKAGAIPIQAGQLYRFVHVVQEGDIVVYPSKIDKQVHIGKIVGPYQYVTDTTLSCHNVRAVKWLKAVGRTKFSQGAIYEMGSAMTLFQIKSYGDEIIAMLEGKVIDKIDDVDDETISRVAEEIEEATQTFILKRLGRELKGYPFEEFVAHLLGRMGYRTRVTQKSSDGGVDIIAHKDELGFEPPIIKVQVKATEGSIGDPVVSALYGKVDVNEFGLLVTLGSFTNRARSFAQNKSNLRLIDGQELVDLVIEHYEQFDSKYKGLLPLKMVYVPESLEGSGE